MRTDADRLLSSWSGNPTPAKAVALCDVLLACLPDDPSVRARVLSIGPALVGRHEGELEVLLALGKLYLAVEELLRADAVLKRALELAPGDARPWRLLGEVYLAAGNARDAEKAFEAAIARGAGDRDTAAWLGRARSYVAMQDESGTSAVAAAIVRGRWSPEGQEAAGGPFCDDEEDDATTSTPALPASEAEGDGALADRPRPSVSDFAETAVRPFKPDLAALARSGPSLPGPDSARTLVHPRPAGSEAARSMPTLRSAIEPLVAPPAAPAEHEAPPPLAPRDVGAVLDEMSMQIDVLKWRPEAMPASSREMDRYLESLRSSEGLVVDEVTRAATAVAVDQGPPSSETAAHVVAMPAQPLPPVGAGKTLVMASTSPDPGHLVSAPAPAPAHHPMAAFTPAPSAQIVDPAVVPRGGGSVPFHRELPHAGAATAPMFGRLPPVPAAQAAAVPYPAAGAAPAAPVPASQNVAYRPPEVLEVSRAPPRPKSPVVPIVFAAVVVVVVALAVLYGWLRLRGGHAGASAPVGADVPEEPARAPLAVADAGAIEYGRGS